MADRIQIYVPDELRKFLGDAPMPSLSARVASIVDRYRCLVLAAMPTMTRGEWCMVMDANNGAIMHDEHGIAATRTHIMANVADHDSLNGGGEKWGMTREQVAALVARLADMTPIVTCAVAEAIEGFWARAEMETDRALKESGAIVS